METNKEWPLKFHIISECQVTKCRTGTIKLPNETVESPVFMPVGTQGTMKGLTVHELEDLGPQIILGNTYHLGMRPGTETMEKAGGLHNFMNWNKALLTDSGGFQMVSLIELSEITEEGVKFNSPYDGKEIMLSPEKSMEIQNIIGADIMMQLDDVVHSTTEGPRVEEAMWRSIRWLDRCIASHARKGDQNLFPILQGGLDVSLRKKCIEEMLKRDLPGIAIGGLSGGEDKNLFWKIVHFCTDNLPRDKPRYLMGVGYAVDLVVCCALGVDMFDCVYPTRTARFGTALVPCGQLQLKNKQFACDFTPIDKDCDCSTCRNHTRAYVHSLILRETVGSHLLTVHNIAYQMKLMRLIRESVKKGDFVSFVHDFFRSYFPNMDYPLWAVDALKAVNITLPGQ